MLSGWFFHNIAKWPSSLTIKHKRFSFYLSMYLFKNFWLFDVFFLRFVYSTQLSQLFEAVFDVSEVRFTLSSILSFFEAILCEKLLTKNKNLMLENFAPRKFHKSGHLRNFARFDGMEVNFANQLPYYMKISMEVFNALEINTTLNQHEWSGVKFIVSGN